MRSSSPARPTRDKRYGWCRLYDDFTGHKKWRLVAKLSGVHLGFVHTIAAALFNEASKRRQRGGIGGFDFNEIEAATDIPAEQVAAVFRALMNIGWLEQEHVVDWLDRQPDFEDPTAAERQRNKRAKDRARRAVATGTATADQVDLLSVEERAALGRLAQLSRVTAAPPAPPPLELIAPFVPARPKENSHEAIQFARAENERAARSWLLGDGSNRGLDYGPASKIVADNFGCNRLNADATIRRWLQDQMAGDVVALATIVSAAEQQALNGDGFRAVVEQRMAEVARERTSGPPLPLGVASIKGGRG